VSAISLLSGSAPGSQPRKKKVENMHEKHGRMWRIREELGIGGKRKIGESQESRI
jgi:hypothetical protein